MVSVWAMIVTTLLNGEPSNTYTTLFDERVSCEREADRINVFPPVAFPSQTVGVLVRAETIALCIEIFPEMLEPQE